MNYETMWVHGKVSDADKYPKTGVSSIWTKVRVLARTCQLYNYRISCTDAHFDKVIFMHVVCSLISNIIYVN